MISLQKTYEYSAYPKGVLKTVKVFSKDTAVEFFKTIDPEILPEQVIRIKGAHSNRQFTLEEIAEFLPTNTNG